MAKKGSQGGSNKNLDRVIPFDQEKEEFMGMIGDVLSNKDFSSPEEANKFLNEAFTGRSMTDSLAEWDTRPSTPLNEARETLNEMPDDATSTTKRRYAKKALEISKDCMEAWEALAWSYQSPGKIESTLLEGLSHGRKLHAELIAEAGEDHGLWGYHEARPFMRLLERLADFYHQDGAVEKVVEVYEEMMTLNPGDNQGIRGVLLHRYLCLKRLNDAEILIERFLDDVDLGIVYGRVLFELIKVKDAGYDFEGLAKKSRISPADFGPPFAKAKTRMKEALKINSYVPLLINHPTSLYLESPASYQFGSPDQAIIFINDHGVDWLSSTIGYFFLGAFQNQSKVLINKVSRQMRESYKDLLSYLDGIDQPSWQSVVLEQMDEFR
jgi:tetratricopeptide (TPR) repeat protein